MSADPTLAAQFHRATRAAAAHRLRLSLGDAAGRNKRVVVYADDLRSILDDYEAAPGQEDALCGAVGLKHALYGLLRCELPADHVRRWPSDDWRSDHMVTVNGGWIKWHEKTPDADPDPGLYFEDGACRFCGVQPGGDHKHKFECANAPEPRRLSDGDGPLKRTPEYWCAKYGVEVHDPDGWRTPGDPSWDEPIPLQDFYERAKRSTTNVVLVDWGRIARDAQEER